MYFNVFGQKVSRRVYKEMQNAAKNRQELIKAGLTSRRDLFKMGLLTAGGMLIAVAKKDADELLNELDKRKVKHWEIGRVAKGDGKVHVLKKAKVIQV
jgi:phosphoribosylaminoimidazole (AIR) synthetase